MTNFFKNIKYFLWGICCFCLPFISMGQSETEPEETEPEVEQSGEEPVDRVNNAPTIIDYLLKEQVNLDYIQKDQLEALEKFLEKRMGNADEPTVGEELDFKNLLETLFPPPPPPPSSIYGHQIFREDSITIFQPTSVTKVSDAYVLGVGDEIKISIFGSSQYDATFEINGDGYIQPKNMAKIFLKGLNWEKAKRLIQNRFKVFYLFRPEQFATTLYKPRTVLVNILGEVEKPGSYNLVATNTAFNALFAAGGPTENGSVRQIRLIRGTTIKELDIYELMANPSVQFDFSLEDNDIIQIPIARKIVEATGAITRPFKYELKDEEGLTELINFAGGFAANAHKELLQINRFTGTERILIDIDWSEAKSRQYNLENGDNILIKEIAEKVTNSIQIEGAVDLPGTYALQSTERITDLLRKARVTQEARLDVAFLIRVNPDSTNKLVQLNLANILDSIGSAIDLPLKADDKLLIYKQKRYTDPSFITVNGSVRENDVKIPFDSDSTVTIQRAILFAGGLSDNASDIGYILRTHPDRSKTYLPIDLSEAMQSPENAANLILYPKDQLYVLGQARFVDSFHVEIKGAVKVPIKLEYSPSLTLKDLFTIAGGFKREAALDRIEVFRLEVVGQEKSRFSVNTLMIDEEFNIIKGGEDFALMPYDEVVVRTIAEYEEPAIITVAGEVAYPGDYALIKEKETLSNIIERAGGVTSEAFLKGASINRFNEGKILLDLYEVLEKNNKNYDFLLRAGDSIQIPKVRDIVFIELENTRFKALGATSLSFSKIGVPFNSGKNAKWYIQKFAGGFGVTANKKEVLVEYANGSVQGVKRFLFFNKYPKLEVGGRIVVGTKPTKEKKNSRRVFNQNKEAMPSDLLMENKNVDTSNINNNR